MDKQKITEKVGLLIHVAPPGYYELKPVATEKELTIFETQFNVRIPEDYRWFVSNIANGIVSDHPFWRITSENNFNNYYHTTNQHNPAVSFNVSERVRFEPETDEDPYDFPYKTIFDPEHELFDGVHNGWIDVGIEELLIVNGVEYGNMWFLDIMSNSEVRPMYDKVKKLERIGFAQWLEEKLDLYIKMHVETNSRTRSK